MSQLGYGNSICDADLIFSKECSPLQTKSYELSQKIETKRTGGKIRRMSQLVYGKSIYDDQHSFFHNNSYNHKTNSFKLSLNKVVISFKMAYVQSIKEMWDRLPILKGYGGAIITALQIGSVVGIFANEINPDTRTQYGKFTKHSNAGTMVSSRTGMLIIYTPALLLSLFLRFFASPMFNVSIPSNPTSLMCAIHFFKRDFEVLFVHEYSGYISLGTAVQIGFAYTLYTIMTASCGSTDPSSFSLVVGSILFIIGLTGNCYHHVLLRNLRKNKGASHKKYLAPNGALFEYVAAPHYSFEIIGWTGIALASEHINVALIAASMSSYLAGRAEAQNKWNRETFSSKEWPHTRKNLIPFIF